MGNGLKAEKEAQPAQGDFGERVTGEKSEAERQLSGEERPQERGRLRTCESKCECSFHRSTR